MIADTEKGLLARVPQETWEFMLQRWWNRLIRLHTLSAREFSISGDDDYYSEQQRYSWPWHMKTWRSRIEWPEYSERLNIQTALRLASIYCTASRLEKVLIQSYLMWAKKQNENLFWSARLVVNSARVLVFTHFDLLGSWNETSAKTIITAFVVHPSTTRLSVFLLKEIG